MSERINVDQAFDPEARKAQAELDAYMDSRPYQDKNGSIHSADGKFINSDNFHDDAREAHYNDSLEQGDYSHESLEQLAQRVADARAEGDKTCAADAEEVFFAKFSEYADKYGWEDEDGSADGPHVDKNAKLGRSTIDDRLDRYGKIMYGEVAAASEESIKEVADEVGEDAEAVGGQDDESTPEQEAPEVVTEEEKESVVEAAEVQSVDEMAEDALARMNERAEEMEREANEARSNTDQAKADKELLASVEEGDDKKAEVAGDASDLEILDESPVMSADDLEILDENAASRTPRSRTRRIRDALTPNGAAAEAATWMATREKLGRRAKITALLGGAALAGALIWAKAKGFDFDNPFNNGDTPTPKGAPSTEVAPAPSDIPTADGAPTPNLVETVRVNPGDGEIKVTQSLLESNGIHVSAAEAQRIGEHAQLSDILRGDGSYDFSGSSMDRIGKTGEFEARSGVVEKLLKSADQLGYK